MREGNPGRGASPLRIVHMSDLHIGSYYFVPDLLEKTIQETNDIKPELVIVTGDLTSEGFVHEFKKASDYLGRIECEQIVVIPGNHDSRHVGYQHFEDIFGSRHVVNKMPGLTVVAIDSSEPDLDSGRIGRARITWAEESFDEPDDFKILALHHHLLPIPGTGRERNIVLDAGDVLAAIVDLKIDLVLMGHKHVPYAWRLEDMFVVNAGTACTLRLRGRTQPCYNVVELYDDRVQILRKYPGAAQDLIVDFNLRDHSYHKTGEFNC